jgi:hypothetical protein
MSKYTCPVAALADGDPDALDIIDECIKEVIQKQHTAMMRHIAKLEKALNKLRNNSEQEAGKFRAAKSQLFASPLGKTPRLVQKCHSQAVKDVGLAFYRASAQYGSGHIQRQKTLLEFVTCSYEGKFLESVQRAHFNTLKFCPIRIARVIDTSSGSINLSTIGAIREMQPGLGFREIGLLPSPSTVR